MEISCFQIPPSAGERSRCQLVSLTVLWGRWQWSGYQGQRWVLAGVCSDCRICMVCRRQLSTSLTGSRTRTATCLFHPSRLSSGLSHKIGCWILGRAVSGHAVYLRHWEVVSLITDKCIVFIGHLNILTQIILMSLRTLGLCTCLLLNWYVGFFFKKFNSFQSGSFFVLFCFK